MILVDRAKTHEFRCAELRKVTRAILFALLILITPQQAVALDLCHSIYGNYCNDFQNGKCRGCPGDCGLFDFDCVGEKAACETLKAGERVLVAPYVVLTDLAYQAQLGVNPQPLPEWVVSALEPFFDPAILADARVTTTSNFGGHQIFLDLFESASALTLGNVITLKNASDLIEGNDGLLRFAHELEHVKQYRDMGRDGFAEVYFLDVCALTYYTPGCRLEQAAYDKQALVAQFFADGFDRRTCLPPPPPPPPLTPAQMPILVTILADYMGSDGTFRPNGAQGLQGSREAIRE